MAAAILIGALAIFASATPSRAQEGGFVPSFWDPNRRLTKPDTSAIRLIRFLTADDYPPFDFALPDGGLTGSGDIVRAAENEGLEVHHQENLRQHYAMTTRAWCRNISANWEKCVVEAGRPTSRVWGLYLAGSSLAFERNEIQLHQVLATRTDAAGRADYPLRPDFGV